MKKNTFIAISLMIIATALYRIIPFRPFGFAPQLAVAVFSGAFFAGNKKLAFLMPLLSMLISDSLYQVLYIMNLTPITGFYGYEQSINYIMIMALTFTGFYAKEFKLSAIITANLSAPVLFFLFSNFFVWATNGGWHRAMNFSGLITCYSDGIPFFINSLMATVIFGFIFFGTVIIAKKQVLAK